MKQHVIYTLMIGLLTTFSSFSQTWTTIPVSGNIQKIAFNQNIGIAVGNNGTILKTIDQGQSFISISSGVSDNLVDVKYVGNNSFIACGWIWGSHGVVLKSTDNGNTWNTVISLNGQFNEMFGVLSLNSDTIFISGTNQFIKTYNGFTSHTISNFTNGYQYRALYFKNNLVLMAHAGTITMRRSNNFGNNYTNSTNQPTSNMLRDMVLTNNNLYAIGDNGAFCKSSDGDNWNMISTQTKNFKSIHELNNRLFTSTSTNIFEIDSNGILNNVYTDINNNINSTGKSTNKLFVLGNNYISFSTITPNCANNTSLSIQNTNINVGSSVSLIGSTSDTNPNFVWQSDFGQGFQTLINFGKYSGIGTSTLQISNIQLSEHKQPIRVITTSGNCIDTSNVALLTLADTCINTVQDTIYTTVTDTLYINTTLGISGTTSNTIKIYPNPANDHLIIDQGNYGSMTGYSITIKNNAGQVVYQGSINQAQVTIDLGTWTGNGIYFIHLLDPQQSTVTIRKIVLN